MSDWKSSVNMTRREAVRVAGAIIGLLAGAVLLLWVASRFLPSSEPPPPSVAKPTPPPQPRTSQ